MPYNQKETIKSFNVKIDLQSFAKNLIVDKEKQIKIASIVPNKSISDSLRDELVQLRKKYSQIMQEDDLGDFEDLLTNEEQPVEDSFGEEDGDPIPASEAELNDSLFKSIADSFTTVLNEENEQVFDVKFTDPETIVIEYNSEKGGDEKSPFIFQNLDQFMKPILLDIIEKIGFGEEDPEVKKQILIDELKEPIQMYRESLITSDSKSDSKKGKSVLIYKRSKDSLDISSKIYDILKKHGLAGPIADMDYENIAKSDNNLNMTGEPAMEANKKSFNLRKKAAKLYDTVREKNIQKTDPQYKSRHGKHALPWYEDVYIPEPEYKQHIMDRYYPEQLNSEGEYRGGYINDRFLVHHNTEGNSMHIKPGEKNVADRTESFSTERRLEEMRENDLRQYEKSEGSRTEQQTNKVASLKKAKFEVTKDHNLYRVACGSKITYLDSEEQYKAFTKIVKELLSEEYTVLANKSNENNKKKISQVTDFKTSPIETEKVNTQIPQQDSVVDSMSPENPLLSIVNDLRNQYPSAKLESIIKQGILQLSSSGMNTEAIERFRVETMKALGLSAEIKDYGQIPTDGQTRQDELEGLMGE